MEGGEICTGRKKGQRKGEGEDGDDEDDGHDGNGKDEGGRAFQGGGW